MRPTNLRQGSPLRTVAVGGAAVAAGAFGFDGIGALARFSVDQNLVTEPRLFLALNVGELAAAAGLLTVAVAMGVAGVRRSAAPLDLIRLVGAAALLALGGLIATGAIAWAPGVLHLPGTVIDQPAVDAAGAICALAISVRILAVQLPCRIVLATPWRSGPVLVCTLAVLGAASVAVGALQSVPDTFRPWDPLIASVYPSLPSISCIDDDGSCSKAMITGSTWVGSAADHPWSSSPVTATVRLVVNGVAVASQAVSTPDGYTFDDVALRPGDNEIVVHAAGTFGWRSFDNSASQDVVSVPQPLAAPRLDPLPSIVGTTMIRITGTAEPGTTVTVRTSRHDLAVGGADQPMIRDVDGIATDPVTGRFAAGIPVTSVSTETITAFATYGQAVSSVSAPAAVRFEPALSQAGEAGVARQLILALSPTNLHADLDVTLPRDDPSGSGLTQGTLPLSEFIRRVVGGVTITSRAGDTNLEDMFAGSQPVIDISANVVRVQAHSTPAFEPGVVTGALSVGWSGSDYLAKPEDSLVLVVRDYRVDALQPAPASFANGRVMWHGSDPDLYGPLTAHVELDPIGDPQAALRLRPYNIVPWPGSALVTLLYALSSGFGIVWLLWLLVRHQDEPSLGPTGNRRLPLLLYVILALSFVPAMLDLARTTPNPAVSLPADSDPVTGQLLSHSANLVVLALVLTLAAVGTRRYRRGGAGLWAWSFVLAASVAAWLGTGIFLVIAAWHARMAAVDYRVIAWLLTAPLLVVAGAATAALLRCSEKPGSRVRDRALSLLAVVLVSSILSWPVATIGLAIAGVDNPYYAVDAVSAALDWSFVRDGYYAVVLGVLLVLRRVSPQSGRLDSRLRSALALLFFAYILTNTSPDLVFLPASLLLALALFRPLVMSRRHNRKELEEIAPMIRERRSTLLARRLGAPTAALRSPSLLRQFVAIPWTRVRTRLGRRRHAGGEASDAHYARFVLAVGPDRSDWSNGLFAAGVGFVVTLPWTALYLVGFALRPEELWGPALSIEMAFTIVGEPLFWVLQAFFLGYFFTDIRGTSGVQKGLRVGLVFTLCALPLWLTSIRTDADAVAVLLRATVEVTALTAVGLLLDARTMRTALGDAFRWVDLARLAGVRSVTALTSFGLASVGVGVTSVVSGEFIAVATLVLHAAGAPTPTAGPR